MASSIHLVIVMATHPNDWSFKVWALGALACCCIVFWAVMWWSYVRKVLRSRTKLQREPEPQPQSESKSRFSSKSSRSRNLTSPAADASLQHEAAKQATTARTPASTHVMSLKQVKPLNKSNQPGSGHVMQHVTAALLHGASGALLPNRKREGERLARGAKEPSLRLNTSKTVKRKERVRRTRRVNSPAVPAQTKTSITVAQAAHAHWQHGQRRQVLNLAHALDKGIRHSQACEYNAKYVPRSASHISARYPSAGQVAGRSDAPAAPSGGLSRHAVSLSHTQSWASSAITESMSQYSSNSHTRSYRRSEPSRVSKNEGGRLDLFFKTFAAENRAA